MCVGKADFKKKEITIFNFHYGKLEISEKRK